MDHKQQLSLVAQYDDLVRYCETLIGGDQIEEKVRRLLENCQKQRLQWLAERIELIELRKKYSESQKDVNRLKTTLRNVRAAFAQEVTVRERTRAERDDLLQKLNQVKDYLIGENPNKSIISSLDLHKLTAVTEEDVDASDKSLSDIDFSKTNDNIHLDDHAFDTEFVAPMTSEPLIPTMQKMDTGRTDRVKLLDALLSMFFCGCSFVDVLNVTHPTNSISLSRFSACIREFRQFRKSFEPFNHQSVLRRTIHHAGQANAVGAIESVELLADADEAATESSGERNQNR